MASSSSGNCYLYEFTDKLILVDIGISYKKLQEKLVEIDKEMKDIHLVVISHEHVDHVKGLQTMKKNNDIPIYLSKGTWRYVKEKYTLSNDDIHFIKSGDQINFADFQIKFHATSHDAFEPLAFEFSISGENYLHMTDTGYVTENLKDVAQKANVLVVESNYEDEVILQNSNYPFQTKKRIISEKGHLSNSQCNLFLNEVVGDKTKLICFAHLSENNNTKEHVSLENEEISVKKVIFDKEETVIVNYEN